jgi:hypothetical protein
MSDAQRSIYEKGIYFFDEQACDGGIASGNVDDSTPGDGAPDGTTFPNLQPTAIANAINNYIKDTNPNSKLAGLGSTIVKSAKNANINPFLIVAIAQMESSLSDPSDFNVSHANNSFGRMAAAGQPSFQGSRAWYKWSSVKASVDYQATENKNAAGGGDVASYLRNQFSTPIDNNDINALIQPYAPSGDGNDTAAYIANVKTWIGKMATSAQSGGGPATTEDTTESDTSVTSTCACSTDAGAGSTSVPSGNDNIEIAFKFFVQNGFTADQTAGIIGNLLQESSLNPKADNGSHRGIAQWDYSGRFAALQRFAGSKDPDTLDVQLQYIMYELNHGYQNTLAAMKQKTTYEDAAREWDSTYEVSGGASIDQRIEKAHQVLEKYGQFADSVSTGTVAASDCSDVTSDGQNTKYTDDGFVVYSQYDPAWKDKPYSSSTIGVSGCGPSAMAMIITNLKGTRVTPVQTADYAASKGIYIPGSGSSWNIGPTLAQHWGLHANALGVDVDSINQSLQAGGLVLAVGRGAVPFTSGGHFIVIRGVTSDGKWKVGDSAHDEANSKTWDPDQLVASIRNNNGGSVYGITK